MEPFIPKPAKIEQLSTWAPLSLMSFIKKILTWQIRDIGLVNIPVQRDQYDHVKRNGVRSGHRKENANFAYKTRKNLLLDAFLDIEGVFDNLSLESIVQMLRRTGIEETS